MEQASRIAFACELSDLSEVGMAIAMALLVPDENRRQKLALKSIASLMHDLFGWSRKQALQEINICVETYFHLWNSFPYMEKAKLRAGSLDALADRTDPVV
jgi:hypothetical protein